MLLGYEGWDIYGTADITDYFASFPITTTIVPAAGICGTAALRDQSAVGNGPIMGVNATTKGGYVAWSYMPESFNGASLYIRSASQGALMFLLCATDGSIQAWKGPNGILGTQLGATPSGLMSTLHYDHIGLEFLVDATVGYMRVYVNGELEFDSGLVNTVGFVGDHQWDEIYWTPIGYIDDLYWGDTTQPEPAVPDNAFLGVCHVDDQLALTDAVGGGGAIRGWTCSTGTDHGALVDENPPDDGATYVYADTPGQQELFKFPPLTVGVGTVYGVMQMPNMAKVDVGGRTVAPLLRSSDGTLTTDTAQALSTSYKYYPPVPLTVDPATGDPFTIASVNAAQFGVEVIT